MIQLTRLVAILVVVLALHHACVEVESAALDSLKSLGKGALEKAADAADKTEPAEETGGVRQTLMHHGANLALEKGLDLIGTKYPAVKAAAPIVSKLAKPAMKKAHEMINNWRKKDDNEAPATDEPSTEDKEAAEKKANEEKQEAEKKAKEEAEKKEKEAAEKKAKEEKEEAEKREKEAAEEGKQEAATEKAEDHKDESTAEADDKKQDDKKQDDKKEHKKE